jgi:hypothetical protein
MQAEESIGRVVSVRGAVVDVAFDGQALPPINTALILEGEGRAPLVLEVHGHVDPFTVRGIALQAIRGLGARRPRARDAGAPVDPGRRRGSAPNKISPAPSANACSTRSARKSASRCCF